MFVGLGFVGVKYYSSSASGVPFALIPRQAKEPFTSPVGFLAHQLLHVESPLARLVGRGLIPDHFISLSPGLYTTEMECFLAVLEPFRNLTF